MARNAERIARTNVLKTHDALKDNAAAALKPSGCECAEESVPNADQGAPPENTDDEALVRYDEHHISEVGTELHYQNDHQDKNCCCNREASRLAAA